MRCISCGADTAPGITTDVTDLGNCLIIIRGVPCHKCIECVEVHYIGTVVKQLEKIIETTKNALTEIAIINYTDKTVA